MNLILSFNVQVVAKFIVLCIDITTQVRRHAEGGAFQGCAPLKSMLVPPKQKISPQARIVPQK